MMSFSFRALAAPALAAAWLVCGPAQAHVGLEWPAAFAGSSYKASFRITHGCGTSPTKQVVVEVPAGVQGARPMPKPGWTVQVERAPLTRITWSARSAEDMLAAEHFDEFTLLATLPAGEGKLYWPVRQVCAEGRLDWVQLPTPGQDPATLKAPAPMLELLPTATGDGHHGH